MIPPVNEHAVELARFLSARAAGGETALAAQMTTTSRDRALAAALSNSGTPRSAVSAAVRANRGGWLPGWRPARQRHGRAYMAVPRRRSDLIAFSAIIAKRRNAEARVGRSGSSRRYSSIIARRLSLQRTPTVVECVTAPRFLVGNFFIGSQCSASVLKSGHVVRNSLR